MKMTVEKAANHKTTEQVFSAHFDTSW